jgi:hypothetical protein
MNPVDTFLPMGLWILATALLVVMLLVVLGFYVYQEKRFKAGIKDFEGVASLAAQKDLLQAGKDELSEWIRNQKGEVERITGERQDQEMLRAELQRLEQECAVKDEGNQSLRDEVGQLENQRHVLTQTLEDLKGKIREAKDAQVIEEDISEIEEQLKVLTEDLNNKRNEQDVILRSVTENKIAIQSLENQRISLEQQAEQFKEEAGKSKDLAKQARFDLEKYKEELDENVSECEKSKRILDTIRTEKTEIEQNVSKLRDEERYLKKEIKEAGGDLVDSDGQKGYSDLLEIWPTCFSKEEFSQKSEITDELIFLENFKESLRSANFYFSERTIDSFHTSLKCHSINPLTVLAGVSGTGKSLLPVKYAEYMGMYSLEIAVQPRWDSSHDLFGFYNYLEKKFKATDLSRALVRLDQYNHPDANSNWVKDRMLIVLLDEMNLARIEYYFSEVLSKLEFRRLIDEKNKAQRVKSEIELDVGPNRKEPFRVWIPENVLFVGTMNEDETTQALSDKVLDRANVLRFGKPEKPSNYLETPSDHSNEVNAGKKYLSNEQWFSWQKIYTKEFDHFEVTEKIINTLNNALNIVHRPFGFRVHDAIGNYVQNYPQIEVDGRYKLAVADQIEQKIIPKLNGLDMDEKSSQCLTIIGKVIKETGDLGLDQAFEKSQEDGKRFGMFKWQGVSREF